MFFTCKTIFWRIYSQNLFCRHSCCGFMIFFFFKTINWSAYSSIAKQAQTNSAICLDGTVRLPWECKSKYSLSTALSLSLSTMIREHISHWKCLINLFVIYPEIVYATSLLSGDKSLFISDSCWAKMLSILSFFWTGFPPKSWCFGLKETDRSIFSQYSILLKDSPKLYHHFICGYWENLFSRGSLRNLWVKINSYPSSKSSCISIACPLKVITKALVVCFVRQKSEICAQDSIQYDNLL